MAEGQQGATSAFSHLDFNVPVPLLGQSTVPGWAGAWSSRAVRRLQQHSADMGNAAAKAGRERQEEKA